MKLKFQYDSLDKIFWSSMQSDIVINQQLCKISFPQCLLDPAGDRNWYKSQTANPDIV